MCSSDLTLVPSCAVERVLRIDFKLDEAQLGNRVVETDALPMGINYGLYHNASSRPEVRRRWTAPGFACTERKIVPVL